LDGPAPAAAPRQLFIYWRVGAADLPLARRSVLELQQRLRLENAGLQASLLLRDDVANSGENTLMEIYASQRGIDASLQRQIEALCEAATAAWRRGPRHVEVFRGVDR
jgi:quinol monooxygenase YgiN